MNTFSTPEAAVTLAFNAAGSARKLALKLGGITPRSVQRWERVPEHWLFEVSRVTMLAPELLRPDLEDWLADRRRQQRLDLARERFGVARATVAIAAPAAVAKAGPLDVDVLDLLITLAAARFVAAERGLPVAQVMSGQKREAAAARAWAMALALVVGRARATNIGNFYGTSRQNVDNAGERYLRARDGDDPDVMLDQGAAGGHVLERGRVRKAKTADNEFWTAERRFADLIAESA